MLAKWIQLLVYNIQDLLQSRIWDTDHKSLCPVLPTLLKPPHWALMQSGLAWVVKDHAVLISKNPGQPPNPLSDNHKWPKPFARSPSKDPEVPRYQNLKSKRGTMTPREHSQQGRSGRVSGFVRQDQGGKAYNVRERATALHTCKSLSSLMELGGNGAPLHNTPTNHSTPVPQDDLGDDSHTSPKFWLFIQPSLILTLRANPLKCH